MFVINNFRTEAIKKNVILCLKLHPPLQQLETSHSENEEEDDDLAHLKMSEQRFRDHIMIMTKESEQPGEIINERIMNRGRENLSQTNMSKSKEK
ncbi:unnamed protein product [Rhizophagus irregularis]|nr:unnamed protein product [Rhizophagus irregularis]